MRAHWWCTSYGFPLTSDSWLTTPLSVLQRLPAIWMLPLHLSCSAGSWYVRPPTPPPVIIVVPRGPSEYQYYNHFLLQPHKYHPGGLMICQNMWCVRLFGWVGERFG
ncbi:hypothetical protein Pcinc_011233 [Petrolisthes cinctipes]|uniref:Uncharacterized protein n=1 Tax=Petrolisthes cinctipes TaxID=88211 RepID=A0AAE1G365_PETCI|nr:hypothetical protein Pcinc_011233 [Petrolisthes cinctipes]